LYCTCSTLCTASVITPSTWYLTLAGPMCYCAAVNPYITIDAHEEWISSGLWLKGNLNRPHNTWPNGKGLRHMILLDSCTVIGLAYVYALPSCQPPSGYIFRCALLYPLCLLYCGTSVIVILCTSKPCLSPASNLQSPGHSPC
jgi:hypothetical protein